MQGTSPLSVTLHAVYLGSFCHAYVRFPLRTSPYILAEARASTVSCYSLSEAVLKSTDSTERNREDKK